MNPLFGPETIRRSMRCAPSTLVSSAPGMCLQALAGRAPAAVLRPITRTTTLGDAALRGAWLAGTAEVGKIALVAVVVTPALTPLAPWLLPALGRVALGQFVGAEAAMGLVRYQLISATAKGQAAWQLVWAAALLVVTVVVEAVALVRLPWHLLWGLAGAALAVGGAAVGIAAALALRWHALGGGRPTDDDDDDALHPVPT